MQLRRPSANSGSHPKAQVKIAGTLNLVKEHGKNLLRDRWEFLDRISLEGSLIDRNVPSFNAQGFPAARPATQHL
jgi:hypothetical protein